MKKMNGMRKLLALVLCLCLGMGACAGAWADNPVVVTNEDMTIDGSLECDHNNIALAVTANDGGQHTTTVEGDVSLTDASCNSIAVLVECSDLSAQTVTIEGNVNVEFEKSGNSQDVTTGIEIDVGGESTENATVVVGGNITATQYGSNTGTYTLGVNMSAYAGSGGATLEVGGSIQAAGNKAIGLSANGNVVAEVGTGDNGGNITAEGDGSVGLNVHQGVASMETAIDVCGDVSGDAAGLKIEIAAGQNDILVEGTISGDTAIVLQRNPSDATQVTAWQVESKGDGKDLVMAEGNGVTDQQAEAFAAAISYIVKLAEGLTNADVSTENKDTVIYNGDQKKVIHGKEDDGNLYEYHTAVEKEKVFLTVQNDGSKILQGIYYNAGDESTLKTVDQLDRDENGRYILSMLRGGGMLLGLKWLTPAPEPKPEPKPEPEPESPSVAPQVETAAGEVSIYVRDDLDNIAMPQDVSSDDEDVIVDRLSGCPAQMKETARRELANLKKNGYTIDSGCGEWSKSGKTTSCTIKLSGNDMPNGSQIFVNGVAVNAELKDGYYYFPVNLPSVVFIAHK